MTPHEHGEQADQFNLDRFVRAQESTFPRALSELRRGRKDSHWMWFIFPQLEGLGSSFTARNYAIRSLDEARAYLAHPILGSRLLECCRAVLAAQAETAQDLMGYPDDLKLRSSMTLFSLVAEAHPEFTKVIDKYFNGEPDPRTIALLRARP